MCPFTAGSMAEFTCCNREMHSLAMNRLFQLWHRRSPVRRLTALALIVLSVVTLLLLSRQQRWWQPSLAAVLQQCQLHSQRLCSELLAEQHTLRSMLSPAATPSAEQQAALHRRLAQLVHEHPTLHGVQLFNNQPQIIAQAGRLPLENLPALTHSALVSCPTVAGPLAVAGQSSVLVAVSLGKHHAQDLGQLVFIYDFAQAREHCAGRQALALAGVIALLSCGGIIALCLSQSSRRQPTCTLPVIPVVGTGKDELHAVQAELRQVSTQLAQQQRDNRDFMSAIAHDLQEPIRAITSYMHLLRRNYGGMLPPQASEFMEYAEAGGRRMQSMLHGLRECARVFSHTQALQPTRVADAVAHAQAALAVGIGTTGARIEYSSLPTVMADPQQLRQLFIQLIDNSLKFRADEAPVICIDACRRQNQWQITVSDNGIGFCNEQSARVFKVFCQLHRDATGSGVGIGLTLCERIIQRHNGRIWASSQSGKGTSVCFTLSVVAEQYTDDKAAAGGYPPPAMAIPEQKTANALAMLKLSAGLACGRSVCSALTKMHEMFSQV